MTQERILPDDLRALIDQVELLPSNIVTIGILQKLLPMLVAWGKDDPEYLQMQQEIEEEFVLLKLGMNL